MSSTSKLDAVLGLSLGTSFVRAPEDPGTSFVFEPTLRYNFNKRQYLQLSSQIVRPTDEFQNFAVNKTLLQFRQGFEFLPGFNPGLLLGVNAVALDRWKADGYMLRGGVGFEAWREFLPGFTILARVTPYGQLSQYTQTTSGKDMPRYGLGERLEFTYVLGRFTFDVLLVVEQRRTTVWNNDFAAAEQVSFDLTKNVSVGLLHELLLGAVDDTTGYFQPVRVYDGRNSRVSAFVQWQL